MKPMNSNGIRTDGRAAGSWRSLTVGSTAFANCWCAMIKLEPSFMALKHLAAAMIAFRKGPLAVNIIYG